MVEAMNLQKPSHNLALTGELCGIYQVFIEI